MSTDGAPLTPTRAAAQRMKELRKRHGWTAQQLAEEMAKAGVQWDRYTVANLERGRRRTLTLDEVAALAYVLDVAFVNLIVPPDSNDFYSVTPELALPANEVRAWIRGTQPAVGQDPRLYFSEVPQSEYEPTPMSQADVAAESARVRFHRQNGHLLREGKIEAVEYHRQANEVAAAARREAADAG